MSNLWDGIDLPLGVLMKVTQQVRFLSLFILQPTGPFDQLHQFFFSLHLPNALLVYTWLYILSPDKYPLPDIVDCIQWDVRTSVM